MQLHRMKCIKHLWIGKYSLEQKCECNMSVLRLYMEMVTFWLNFTDRVVLAHLFWGLAIFPVYSSLISCWTNRKPSTLPSSVFLHSCRGFQLISIDLMTRQISLSTFPLSALILTCSLKPFLLLGKADTDVFDYSSFVANWDAWASTVQMHLHKQQKPNWRIQWYLG